MSEFLKQANKQYKEQLIEYNPILDRPPLSIEEVLKKLEEFLRC